VADRAVWHRRRGRLADCQKKSEGAHQEGGEARLILEPGDDGPGGDGGALFRRQAHPVLLGGDKACVVDGGAVVQEGEVAVGQGGVVGEGDEILEVAAGGDQ